MGGRLLDLVVVSWLSLFVLVEILGRLLGGDPLGRGDAADQIRALSGTRTVLGVVLVVLACEVIPLALWGASLGKAMVGLRVVRFDTFEPVRPVDAVIRSLVLYGPLAVPLVGGVLSLAIVVPVFVWPTRRGLHDVAAGTVVVALEAPWEGRGSEADPS